MVNLHNQIISEFKSKISDLMNKIETHKLQAEVNQTILIEHKNKIIDDTNQRNKLHDVNTSELNGIITSQNEIHGKSNLKKIELSVVKNQLELNIDLNRTKFNENMKNLIDENELALIEKENRIESLSSNVSKLQNEVACNIHEIRQITNDKNSMVNYLVNSY